MPAMGQRLDTDKPDELAATAGWAADWFYAERLKVKPDDLPDELRASLNYRQVLRECAEVLRDSWRAGREVEAGRTVSPPRYPALNAKPLESNDGNRANDDRAKLSLSRYFDDVYLPAHAGELRTNTFKVKVQSVKLFGDLVGDPPLYLLSRAQLSDFQSSLKLLPDGRLITGPLKDKSLREIVDLQRRGTLKLKRLGAGTITKHVGNIKTIISFALSEGHVRLNPSVGMRNVKTTDANPRVERRPFNRRELEAIFSQPLYAGCKADTTVGVYRPGQTLIRDERFWIPMLLFLTGARASEVAGLERSEVKIDGGVVRIVFKYTALRRLKNEESERVIPLHPWALAMGFERYLETLPADATAIFPAAVAEALDEEGLFDDDRLDGTPIFRQFNRTLLKHVGLDRDSSVSLHSFRHVFEDAMTGRDIPDEVMFRLTGRTIKSSRGGYARNLPADEERRAQRADDYMRHVERIDFGGLDLSHLYTSPG
jgi:integrase